MRIACPRFPLLLALALAVPAFVPVGLATDAFAHAPAQGADPLAPDRAGGAFGIPFTLAPWAVGPLLLLGLGYGIGVARLWRRAGLGRGVATHEPLVFAAGLAALALSLVWPLDALGERSLAAHMAQHMVLLALAPPLLWLGRPAAVIAHALPRLGLPALQRAAGRSRRVAATHLAAAVFAHGAVMWAWHLPAATAAALDHDGLHWAMHASFLAVGLWFWACLLRGVRDPSNGAGPAMVAVVVAMMQMGLLGALLSFAPAPLYDTYVARAATFGLDPLADQQLAGVLMWVPACVPYLVGGLWLMALSLRRLERRDA